LAAGASFAGFVAAFGFGSGTGFFPFAATIFLPRFGADSSSSSSSSDCSEGSSSDSAGLNLPAFVLMLL
jgi:hypothetical protein